MLIKSIVTLVAVATFGVASAQFRDLNDSSKGEGTYYQGGSGTRNIDRATVRLLQNKQFTVTVSGQRTGTFTGVWDLSGNRDVHLNIKTINGVSRNVSGRGHITLTGGLQVTNMELDGEVERNSFRVRYDAKVGNSGPGWGGSGNSNDWGSVGGMRDFRDTIRGRGTMTIDGNRSDLEYAQIDVRSNGKFTIRVKGDKDVTFEGTASRQGQNDFKLRITRGFSRPVTGDGSISVRPDGTTRSLTLDGRADGKRYRIQVND